MPAGIAPPALTEARRLRALRAYRIVDAPPEPSFGRLVDLATAALGVRYAAIGFVDERRVWFAAGRGVKAASLPRAGSPSDYVVVAAAAAAAADAGAAGSAPPAVLLPEHERTPAQQAALDALGLGDCAFYAAAPLVDEEGHRLGALAIADELPRDLSAAEARTLATVAEQVVTHLALRRRRQEIDRERATLREMNEELERFAAVAAHDLRSPLRAMGSFAGLLRRRLRDRITADELEMFDHIRNGAARLSAMVEGILGVAQAHHQDFAKREVIDLPTVTAETADLVDPEQHFRIEFDGACPRIRASAPAVKQILLNLISNAVKYHDKPAGSVVVSCRREATDYVVTVADDGPGIAAADQERIFEAFETGADAPRVPSTGLGLALVRRVVARLGGAIGLDSAPGEGSRFTVRLPLG